MAKKFVTKKFGNSTFSAKEMLGLKDKLLPNDAVRNENDRVWQTYASYDFQKLAAEELGYSIGNDGTIHSKGSSNNSLWILIIAAIAFIAIIIAVAASNSDNSNSCSQSEPKIQNLEPNLEQTSQTNDQVSTEPVRIQPKQQESVSYDWSGLYKAETDAGSTYGGTPILYNINLQIRSQGNNDYTGTISIDGYQTDCTYSVTGYANQNVLRIICGNQIGDGIGGGLEANEPIATIYYNNDGTLTVQWHQEMQEYYVNENTTFEKE